jgi:hypothetical protein
VEFQPQPPVEIDPQCAVIDSPAGCSIRACSGRQQHADIHARFGPVVQGNLRSSGKFGFKLTHDRAAPLMACDVLASFGQRVTVPRMPHQPQLRRLPAPWRTERILAGWAVLDASGRRLAYVYGSDERSGEGDDRLTLDDRAGSRRTSRGGRYCSLGDKDGQVAAQVAPGGRHLIG